MLFPKRPLLASTMLALLWRGWLLMTPNHKGRYYFAEWLEGYLLQNQEAIMVAEELVKDFVCRFGVPLIIHSDHLSLWYSRRCVDY